VTRAVEVRRGAYQDSVALMQISQDLQKIDGVRSALVAMATELNLDLLDGMGFARPESSPNDMVVAIEADDDEAVGRAMAALGEALTHRPVTSSSDSLGQLTSPTVAAAARAAEADLALVSTPGRVAVLDAVDALDSGLDVMLFSDNVAVEHEVALKERAASAGLLVMGPDCGTAVVGGVGLGFANVVRPGPVGIVAASGTGAQHLMALLDDADIGVAHCLGVGGRDLSSAVQGRSTFAAIDRLVRDERVELIVVISKPPAAEVAAALRERATEVGTPVLVRLLGPGEADLTQTAAAVAEALGRPWREPTRLGPSLEPSVGAQPGQLRGLFSGGTLCDEAMLIAAASLGEVWSNIPLAGQPALDDSLTAPGRHVFIDFGDDRLTAGRPHPMIDGTIRNERLARDLDDPDCAVVLLDVVLGHGAHADPAAELAPLIASADKPVIVSLVGTGDDPQGRDGTAARLVDAGAVVHASNAAAAREAVMLVSGGTA
jgi:FdrA protein